MSINTEKELSRSEQLVSELIYEAMKILEEGGDLPSRTVMEKLESRIELDEWARGIYDKSGYIR